MKSDFLVRAAWDRNIENDDQCDAKKIWGAIDASPVIGTAKTSLKSNGNKVGREVILDIKCTLVSVKPPRHKAIDFESVDLYVVSVKEGNPPENIKPIEWVLLTNIPCENYEDVLEKVSWYKARWQIEVFHKVLKSGCRIEDCRLKTFERIARFLTVMSIISWRLQYMTYLAREDSNRCCTTVFSEHEWKALQIKITKNKTISKPPSLQQCIKWMAKLGGYLDRKFDGDPGIVYIWRGWQRLNDIAEDYLLFSSS